MRITLQVSFDLNDVIAAAKRSPYSYAAKKKKAQTAIVWLLKSQGVPVIPGRNHYAFTWYIKDRRKDPDNIAAGYKVIFDAMQEAGIIENDGHKQISGFSHEFKLDKKRPRVEITVNAAA